MLFFEGLDGLWAHLQAEYALSARPDADGGPGSAGGTPAAVEAAATEAGVAAGAEAAAALADPPLVPPPPQPRGGFAHFCLLPWGDTRLGGLDFAEVWFLAVCVPRHPSVAAWRARFAAYWVDREAAVGAVDDPFFAGVGLGPGSRVPAWGEPRSATLTHITEFAEHTLLQKGARCTLFKQGFSGALILR